MPPDIHVKVVPRAKRDLIREESGILKIYTTAPAVEDRANEAVKRALAEHFSVKPRQVELLRGAKSRMKVFRINP